MVVVAVVVVVMVVVAMMVVMMMMSALVVVVMNAAVVMSAVCHEATHPHLHNQRPPPTTHPPTPAPTLSVAKTLTIPRSSSAVSLASSPLEA